MAINGFNENMLMAEDADFAKRLKEWGKRNNKKFGTIKNGMITSCRRFDTYGDWALLKNPKVILAYLKGNDQNMQIRHIMIIKKDNDGEKRQEIGRTADFLYIMRA